MHGRTSSSHLTARIASMGLYDRYSSHQYPDLGHLQPGAYRSHGAPCGGYLPYRVELIGEYPEYEKLVFVKQDWNARPFCVSRRSKVHHTLLLNRSTGWQHRMAASNGNLNSTPKIRDVKQAFLAYHSR